MNKINYESIQCEVRPIVKNTVNRLLEVYWSISILASFLVTVGEPGGMNMNLFYFSSLLLTEGNWDHPQSTTKLQHPFYFRQLYS